MLHHYFSGIPECFILRVNPIFECTCATVWRHRGGENCKITFSRWHCVRAMWKQQETAREIKPFSSQMQVFLECFCLQDLGQACLSLIITQVLFSAKCGFYFHWESLVNRSGGVRKQVNRGRVFHSAWRRVFLARHRPSWMDNWALCEPSWQRTGPERETAERVKTPRPCWKSSIFHCFNLATCRSPVEISKGLHLPRTRMKRPFKAPLIRPPLPPGGDKTWRDLDEFI